MDIGGGGVGRGWRILGEYLSFQNYDPWGPPLLRVLCAGVRLRLMVALILSLTPSFDSQVHAGALSRVLRRYARLALRRPALRRVRLAGPMGGSREGIRS